MYGENNKLGWVGAKTKYTMDLENEDCILVLKWYVEYFIEEVRLKKLGLGVPG